MPFFDELTRELDIENRLYNISEFARYYFSDEKSPVNPMQVDPWIESIFEQIDVKRHPTRKRIVFPAPRGHSKTTAISKIYPLVTYLRKRDESILIIRKSEPMAREAIKWLKDTIDKNKKLMKDFGILKDTPWGANTLYCKRGTSSISDPTFKGIGVQGAITGGHFGLIAVDDMLDDLNTATEHQRNVISEWFDGTVMPLLQPWGQIVVLCTRKHYRDKYGELLENPTWWHPDCRYEVEANHQRCGYRAIITEPMYDYSYDNSGKMTGVDIKGDYEVLWPQFQTIEKLLTDKESMGTIMFNREYQNDPSGMTDLVLLDSWLKYWSALGGDGFMKLPPPSDLYVIASYDLAASTAPDAHYFGYVIMGRDKDGRIYLLEARRKRLDFPAQLRLLQEIANRPMAPKRHLIETNAYQRSLAQAGNWMLNLPIKPVQTIGPKDVRTIAITPHLENGRIFIHKSQKEFLEEYRQFPTGKYDDILDAFVMAVTELTTGISKSLDYILVDSRGKDLLRRR